MAELADAASSTSRWVLIVALAVVPVLLSLLLLVAGLAIDAIALVYLSIACSVLTVPCWVASLVLLVRTVRRPLVQQG